MSDDFVALIDRANAFFTKLAANNTREWFTDHKQLYETDIRKPAEFLADLMAEDLSRAFGQPLNPKVFRIYRDVRFSKDKTPYNTHLHLLWSPPQSGPLWFLGSSPDYLIVGCGKMAMDKPTLDRFRAAVDRDGDALQAALAQVLGGSGAEIGDVGAQPLKRVPKPYDADHPQAELLKRKALTVTAPLPNDWRDRGVIASALATMHNLAPVGAWLKNHVI